MPTPLPQRHLDRLAAESRPAIVLSRDYVVLAANDAYRERFGDGIRLGRDRCHAVSHGYAVPCDRMGESCPLATAVDTRQPTRVLHIHHGPDRPEHVDVHAVPLTDRTGQVAWLMEILEPVDAVGEDAGIVGRSQVFLDTLGLVKRVAPTELPVLLLGETGTGKDGLARAVHRMSGRAGNFVALECSGLPESLFESELFGYEPGAFTGARHRKQGLVEVAADGTLFLDEVGELPPSQQAKLLRLLESGTYRRVGGLDPQRATFRLVCATHRDLAAMVEQGDFRQDLYYRIATFPVRVPPLRERGADLDVLVGHLLAELAPDRELAEDTWHRLRAHPFPGNIRELRNVLQRAALLADGRRILPEHLPAELAASLHPAPPVQAAPPRELRTLAEVERDHLARAVATWEGDRAGLARALGISERTLYRRLKAHGLAGR